MNLPKELRYTKDHEWISQPKNGRANVGVTAYAIEQLGDIVHIEPPEVGLSFEAGESFGTIESTKTVSDLYLPVTGTIVEVNDDIIKNLDLLKEDPYDDGWLVKVEVDQPLENFNLLDAKAYEKYISEQ